MVPEQFDILDHSGNQTGITQNKGEPLNSGQYYLGVHVYLFNSSGEFLIQQRALDKKFLPGGWDIVAEHTMAGETSVESAIRGVQEELGISIPSADMLFVGRIFRHEMHHITDVYFAQISTAINELVLQPTEVIVAKFISKEEMATLVEQMHYRPEDYKKLVLQHIWDGVALQ